MPLPLSASSTWFCRGAPEYPRAVTSPTPRASLGAQVVTGAVVRGWGGLGFVCLLVPPSSLAPSFRVQ